MKRVFGQISKIAFALAAMSVAASAFASAVAQAPVPTGGNDPGCPNTSSKTGVYAPCVGYLPPTSTFTTPPNAQGVHHLSTISGVVVPSMNTQQAAAKGLLPNALNTPSFGVLVAVSQGGGAGQQNPTSAAQTAQQYCGTGSSPAPGTDGWSYSANPQWSGWDNLNNPPRSYKGWNYSCQFTPQPTQACSYISSYDANGNAVWTNYTAYGTWSWGNGNNGTWSQPSCSTPNAPAPTAKPTCQAGQTQTAAPTWNGSQWVGLACSAPSPPQQPPPPPPPTNPNNPQPCTGPNCNNTPPNNLRPVVLCQDGLGHDYSVVGQPNWVDGSSCLAFSPVPGMNGYMSAIDGNGNIIMLKLPRMYAARP